MKLVTYEHQGQRSIAGVVGGELVDLSPVAPDMLGLIELASTGMEQALELCQSASERLSLQSVNLLAPIPLPRRNVFCLGLNYAEHADEHYKTTGHQPELPEYPIIFTKATTAVNGPYNDIPYDPSVSSEYDWEAELAVIIGNPGKNISLEDAMEHVFGYTIINDVSARDLQRRHIQYFKGKSLDGACPMGPWIVTKDELVDPHNLRITSLVNGVVKQDSNTRQMIFNVAQTIQQLSLGMTLLPGDIIATGTPSGVGFARQPPEFLGAGDEVICRIEAIGEIRNKLATI